MDSWTWRRRIALAFDDLIVGLCWTVVAISWVGVTLAELGRFSAVGTFVGSLILLGLGVAGHRWTRGAPAPVPKYRTSAFGYLALLAIVVVAAVLYLRPAEAVFGTHDAGLRLNAAAHIAQSGGIPIADPDLTIAVSTDSLSEPLGLYDVDPQGGRLLPQFSGVLEAWEAVVFATLNPPSSLITGYQQVPVDFPERPLYVVPIAALVALVVLFETLTRAFGPSVALTATAGLAFSYPEVYFARLTMAEIPTQLFCVVALCGLARFWETNRAMYAALAGAAIGLAFLTHIDAALLFLPATLWFAWLVSRRRLRRQHLAFFAPAGALLLQGCWHYVRFEWPYVQSNFAPLVDRVWQISPVIRIVVSIAVVGGLGICLGNSGSIDSALRRPRVRLVAAGAFVCLATFAYFGRPLLEPPVVIQLSVAQPPLVDNAGVSLVLLAEFVGPLTIALATIGIALFLVRGEGGIRDALFVGGGIYLLVFGWNAMVSPHQPFWVRRFLPEAIPTILVFASLGIAEAFVFLRQSRVRFILVEVLSALLLVGVVSISLPIWTLPPLYHGGLAESSAFAHALPTDSIVIFDRTEAGRWLPLPLTYLFHRDSFVYTDGPLDPRRLDEAITTWRARGKDVVLVTTGGEQALDVTRWAFQPLVDQRFLFPQFVLQYWSPPTTYEWVNFHASAYRVVPRDEQPPPTFPLLIPVGQYDVDINYLVDGFYPTEYAGAGGVTSYRFTTADAEIDLPRPVSGRVRISLRIAGQRPSGAPPATLQIGLDDHPLGTVRFDVGGDPMTAFQDYTFDTGIPPGDANVPLHLRLQTNSWRPADYGSGDTRDVGVALMAVRVEPAN